MADFPGFIPASRSYSFAEYPITVETGFGGGNIRFLHNSSPNGLVLDLTFNALSRDKAQQIRDHYRTQDGTFKPFYIPAVVWTGLSNKENVAPVTTFWRYAEPPSEEHLEIGNITVSVKLLSIFQ